MHLIFYSSATALVTMSTSIAPEGGLHRKSATVCTQMKPAHIPHHTLREFKVQKLKWHERGPSARERMNQL